MHLPSSAGHEAEVADIQARSHTISSLQLWQTDRAGANLGKLESTCIDSARAQENFAN